MSMTDSRTTVVSFDESVLERMVIAVEQVRDRLRRSTAALEKASVPYAVIGGNAVAAWVSKVDPAAARNTVDVDLLVRRENFEAAKLALESAGFEYSFTFGVQLFVDGPKGKAREGVHLMFANEKVKPEYVAPMPDVSASTREKALNVINLEELVIMKLTSLRDKDRAHLRDMIDVQLLDRTWLAKLPQELADRLKTILDTPEG